MHRGIVGRNAFLSALKLHRDLAAARMQSLYRGKRGRALAVVQENFVNELRRIEREKIEEANMRKDSQTVIGKIVRGKAGRKKALMRREELKIVAIIKIQRVGRGRRGRVRAGFRREMVAEELREVEEARAEAKREMEEEERIVRQKQALADKIKRVEAERIQKEKNDISRKAEERERLTKLVEEEEAAEEKEEIEKKARAVAERKTFKKVEGGPSRGT